VAHLETEEDDVGIAPESDAGGSLLDGLEGVLDLTEEGGEPRQSREEREDRLKGQDSVPGVTCPGD
jgi:hypothetical protein